MFSGEIYFSKREKKLFHFELSWTIDNNNNGRSKVLDGKKLGKVKVKWERNKQTKINFLEHRDSALAIINMLLVISMSPLTKPPNLWNMLKLDLSPPK